jgi:hypothetical protein
MAADLTPEQIRRIMAMGPGESGVTIDGTFYQPHYSSNAQGEAGHGQGGQLLDIYGYDPTKTEVGQQYGLYGDDGKYQGQGAFKKVKDGDLIAMGLLSAFGMGMLPGVGAGGAATGAGVGASPGVAAVAGDAMMPGALASTGGLAAPYGSVLPGLEAFVAPAATAETAGAAFNAAKDSQMANAAINAAGGDALSGYTAALNGGVTASPVGTSFVDTLKTLATKALPEGAGMNLKTLAAALPLIGTLAGGKQAQGTGAGGQPMSAAQQEYMNRPLSQWDWTKLQRDAQAAGMGLNEYMAKNWNRMMAGEYNQQPVAKARGGLASFLGGPANGRADTVPAELSDGEYVMDAETVALLGDGNNKAGAQMLDQMRNQLRQHKGEALARGQFSPAAKAPLAYMAGEK